MPILEILKNSEVIRRVEIDQPRFVVGRQDHCDLVLDDEWISREHLAISKTTDGVWEAIDLQSGNGSFLGDERIEAVPLKDGDVIRLGSSLLRFLASEPQAPKPEEAAAQANESALARQLLEEKTKNRLLQAELDVIRTGSESGGSSFKSPDASDIWQRLLNPRLKMHFLRPDEEAGRVISNRPESQQGRFKWSFLGLGRVGDSFGLTLTQLGRLRVRVLLESLLPQARIQSPAKTVIRVADEDGMVPLSVAAERSLADLDSWLNPQGSAMSDLFLMASADLFGTGSLATSRLSTFLRQLRGSVAGRIHMILVQDTSDEAVDGRPWKSALDLDLLNSVLCVDRQHVESFAGDHPENNDYAFTTLGILDSLQRLAHFRPFLGDWGEQGLSAFLGRGGFMTLGCSATTFPSRISRIIKDVERRAWLHTSFGPGLAREVFFLAVVGKNHAQWAEKIRDDLANLATQWPQAKVRIAVYVDTGGSIRLFSGMSGLNQSPCS